MENKNISPAVSIIIPMYNVEKYVAELLDSILAQTFKNFEVILVDNGSTDKSHAIAESYIPKFAENIQGGALGYKIITLEENLGSPAPARNVGMKQARGEYLYNMDRDVVLTPTALEEIYNLAKENNADSLYCPRHYAFWGETLKESKKIKFDGEVTTVKDEEKIEFIENPFLKFSFGQFGGAPWKHLHRRKLIQENNLEFPNLLTEDRLFNISVLFFSKKTLFVPNVIYYWRKHETSTSSYALKTVNEVFKIRATGAIKSAEYLKNFMDRFDFFTENSDVRYRVFSKFVVNIMDVCAKADEVVPMQERDKILNELLDTVKDKKYLTTFLFNKTLDEKTRFFKNQSKIEKLKINVEKLNTDNKKLQTENQELKLKVQSTSEITSKILEKIEDKTQLAPFLFNQAIDLKEEALKKDIELKKLREENKKLLEENKKIQEQLAATSKKLQDEIKKLQSAAS